MAEKRSVALNKVIMVLIHVAGWAAFILYPYFTTPRFFPRQSAPGGIPPGGPGFRNPNGPPFDITQIDNHRIPHLVFNLLLLLFFYANMYFLIPKVLTKKGWVAYALCVIISFPLLYGIHVSVREALGMDWFNLPPMFLVLPFLVAFAFSTSLRLTSDRIRFDRERKERENENLKSELSFLRSQVSPHFMFNVLNSLASLARKKSDALEPVIIQLSFLMRYMLYDAGDKRVTLGKEIEYLRSYIDLQKLRFGLDVVVRFQANVTNQDKGIEPMLLIPFVENAFKHGIGMVPDPTIDIVLRADEDTLYFVVKNKFNLQEDQMKDESSGIGLTNTIRRLKLLYKDKHTITTSDTNNEYVVELKIIMS